MVRTRLVSIVAVAAGACALTAFAGESSSAHLSEATRYYTFASRALQTGNVAKARSYFEKALKIFPGFPEAHLGMGHIAMNERRFDDALREYQTARDAYRGVGVAIEQLKTERYTLARQRANELVDEKNQIYRQMVSGKGSQNYLQVLLLKIEQQIQELESTEVPGREAPLEAPAEVHYHLGNAYFRLDRLDDAIGSWERCTHMNPEMALAWNNLAVAYWKKGRIQAAMASLDKASHLGLTVNPSFRADLERVAAARSAPISLGLSQ